MARSLLLLLLAFTVIGAPVTAQQAAPTNLDFETGMPGDLPSGWQLSTAQPQPGVSARLVTDDRRSGAQAVLLTREATAAAGTSLNLLQIVDASAYRGRRLRYRMAVRTETPVSPAQMWMRIDGAAAAGAAAPNLFLDTMDDRPITGQSWAYYEIVTDVPQGAARIAFGVYLVGAGKAWVDDALFETVARTEMPSPEAPRAITRRGVANLMAFARLLGYVKYFHPSDEAARTDWDAFTIAGIRAVESSADGAVLTQRLADLFRPIAPSIVIVQSGTTVPAPPPVEPGSRQLIWRHVGFGLSTAQTTYRSERVTTPQPASIFSAELGGGVSVRIPVSVATDDTGTLPRGTVPATPPAPHLTRGRFPVTDRATRLAAVVLAWNVFQHSYPYFDGTKVVWSSALSTALQEAATDQNEREFVATLRRMMAAAHDGQARVTGPADADLQFTPPVALDWVEDTLVVAAADAGTGARPGDVVIALDGTPAPLMLSAAEGFVSAATPQWTKLRAVQELLAGPKGTSIKLRVERAAEPAQRSDLTLTRSVTGYAPPRRAEAIGEVQNGVMYVDLARVTEAEFTAALPRLAEAKGIVFDLRSSPAYLGPDPLFSHLTDKPVTSPQWHLPQIAAPDRELTTYVRSGEWNIAPKVPYLAAKKIFLTGANAVGYAESCLAIVASYKLGEILGGATAGTTGTMNRFMLPGDYTVVFTGTKVLKQDGTQFHGIGITPTIAVAPTRMGLAAGRDELLDRAVQVLTTP